MTIRDAIDRLDVLCVLDAPSLRTAVDMAKDALREVEALGGLDRLRELVQVDQEGRCVVLPCAIGDPVYIIRWHIGSAAMGDETYRFVDSFPARFGVEMLGDFGKTVFRSYAEARKALEKEENRNG